MNKQRTAVLVCAAIGMLATFMPWITVPIIGSINGTQGNLPGWITLFLFAVPLALSLLGDKTKSLEGLFLYASIGAALIASGIGIYRIFDLKHALNGLSSNSDNALGQIFSTNIVSVGFGLYLLSLTGIVLAVCALAVKDKVPAAVQVTEDVV